MTRKQYYRDLYSKHALKDDDSERTTFTKCLAYCRALVQRKKYNCEQKRYHSERRESEQKRNPVEQEDSAPLGELTSKDVLLGRSRKNLLKIVIRHEVEYNCLNYFAKREMIMQLLSFHEEQGFRFLKRTPDKLSWVEVPYFELFVKIQNLYSRRKRIRKVKIQNMYDQIARRDQNLYRRRKRIRKVKIQNISLPLRSVMPHVRDASIYSAIAPPGLLGISLENKANGHQGTVVSGIKSGSPLKENVSLGDRIIAIDGVDVSHMMLEEIVVLLKQKIQLYRNLLLLSNKETDSSSAPPLSKRLKSELVKSSSIPLNQEKTGDENSILGGKETNVDGSSASAKVSTKKLPSPLSTKSKSKELARNISHPTKMDVLTGRGGRSNNWPGNKRYHQIILYLQNNYAQLTSVQEKTEMSRCVVDSVHKYNGRFLALDKTMNPPKWHEITDTVARRKVSQALREEYNKEKRKEKRTLNLERKRQKELLVASEDRRQCDANASQAKKELVVTSETAST